MQIFARTCRRFLLRFSGLGLSYTLLPGVLCAKVQEKPAQRITKAMLRDAEQIAGVQFDGAERELILNRVNENLERYDALVHSSTPTATGLIQRSTETVDLTGDLTGRILYHPTSVIDFSTQTVVNSGHQVFSGTVLGSEPVLLHDDTFRFEIDSWAR
jgi:hypothetical protein